MTAAVGGSGRSGLMDKGLALLPSLLAAGALGLAWPALQLALFAGRFGGLGRLDPRRLEESLVFWPMGLAGAAVLIWCWHRGPSPRQRAGAVLGYVLAMPAALLGSLMGGLLLPPLPGTLLFGALPLALGTLLGYGLVTATSRAWTGRRGLT